MGTRLQHFIFAGGGTAGHLFPGLAVAEHLACANSSAQITFAGTGKELESRHVLAAGFDYVTIPSRPAPRNAGEALGFLAASVSGYYVARQFLKRTRASLVVGLGGYASVPMARAAARRDIPVVLLEQNAFPGRATRWLASSADAVCAAFEEVRPHLRPTTPLFAYGNPIRSAFMEQFIDPESRFAREPRRTRQLLVLGGSGGSATLNEQVPRALYKAKAAIAGWRIIHQTGDRNAEAVRALYGKFGINATVSTFFDDVPRLLAETDLAVSRAGGTSLAELAACAVPTILVPYENALDNHQRRNADVFHDAGAALLVDSRDQSGRLDDRLAGTISHLARHTDLRRRLSESIATFARPNAARNIAKTIRKVLHSHQHAAIA